MCIVHVHTLHSHPFCPPHGVRALGCLFSVLWDSHLPRPEDQRAGRLWSAQLPPPPLPPPLWLPPSSRLLSRLQRQRPRLPSAHLSAALPGSFVTTLVCLQTQTMPCLLCVCRCFIAPSPPFIVYLWRLVSCHFAQDMIRRIMAVVNRLRRTTGIDEHGHCSSM